MADTVLFLTSGTSFARPADWNDAANTIEAIGGGGDSGINIGAKGGCYAKIVNHTLASSTTFQIGVHGGTTGAGTTPTANTWFKNASTLVAPGVDDTTTNCVGSTVFHGGTGGTSVAGGGAAGPNGHGNNGVTGTGGSGDAGFGGAGGTSGASPTAGSPGTEWTSNPGGASAGSGGGGGRKTAGAGNGGVGGNYGGGCGANNTSGSAAGASGIIVITYTPIAISTGGWLSGIADFPKALRRNFSRNVDETVFALLPLAPVSSPNFGWNTCDDTAPRRRQYHQLDEAAVCPPIIVPLPNIGWITPDDTAPKKRKYQPLDQIVLGLIPPPIPPPVFGWNSNDDTPPRKRRYRQLDEAIGVLTLSGLPAPRIGWLTQDDTPPRRRKYRQLDETVLPLKLPISPALPGELTDVEGVALTDTAGVHLTDVGAPTPSIYWQTNDTTAPRKRCFRQLDETAQAPSPFNLPAAPAINFGWATADEPARARKRFRSLDEVSAPIFQPAAAVVTPSDYWMAAEEPARIRRRYSKVLDEVVAPIAPPTPVVGDIVIFLTSGTSFARPADWNDAANHIEALGAGADSSSTTGGIGGCYAKIVNYVMPSSLTYQIGLHGGTTGAGTSPTSNSWITDASTLVAAGAASATTNCVGTTVFAGGASGVGFGGGGAAGPNGNGTTATTSTGGSGDAGFGGAGGAPGNPPSPGGNGAEWLSNPGGLPAGSGGGGGKAQTAAQAGGAGGLYGGAAGGRFTSGTGQGANGIIVLTYTPLGAATTPSTMWMTQDETAPRKRRFRQLDETVAPIFPPPFIATTPTDFWQTDDETAPRRRRYRQLDEVVQAPSPLGLPAPPFGWASTDEPRAARRKYRQFDETLDAISPPAAVAAPSFGWNANDLQLVRRRRYRQFDDTLGAIAPPAVVLPPGALTDTLGIGLTDTLGVQLTDVQGSVTPSILWDTADTTRPRRRRYRQLDETAHVISALGLPTPVATPSTFWLTNDETAARKRRFRQLDETVQAPSPFGLPAVVTTPSTMWMTQDEPRARRRRYRQLDEVTQTLTLPPGLPVPVPPPTPVPPDHCAERNALTGPFVSGPNRPQFGDLVVAVLQELGVLAAGQLVTAEDTNTIILRLFPKIEELNERDVAFIDPDNISNAQFLPLVKIMACECASAFSITDPMTLQALEARGGQGGEAEGALKDLVRTRTPRQVLRNEIFTRRR